MDKFDENTNFGITITIDQYGSEWESIEVYNKDCVTTFKSLLYRLSKMKTEAEEYLIEELNIKVKI